jgi:3D (Asp-Asp-Asp) domain-containing protein
MKNLQAAIQQEQAEAKARATAAAAAAKSSAATARPAAAPVRNNGASQGVAQGKEIYVTATAYTADCNGCSGRTATGLNVKANPNMKVIAVDPRIIPLGSRVWVEGYGQAIAGDTGGAIKGHRIDILMPTKAQALAFGRRTVKVVILN